MGTSGGRVHSPSRVADSSAPQLAAAGAVVAPSPYLRELGISVVLSIERVGEKGAGARVARGCWSTDRGAPRGTPPTPQAPSLSTPPTRRAARAGGTGGPDRQAHRVRRVRSRATRPDSDKTTPKAHGARRGGVRIGHLSGTSGERVLSPSRVADSSAPQLAAAGAVVAPSPYLRGSTWALSSLLSDVCTQQRRSLASTRCLWILKRRTRGWSAW